MVLSRAARASHKDRMKIIYLANIRLPTEKAHGIQIMKACEAFAKSGHAIELVVPNRWTPIAESQFAYYSIKKQFPVRRIFTLDWVRWGYVGFLMQTLSFAISAARYVRSVRCDVVYGRDEMVLAVALLFGARNVVWESHDGSWNAFARFVARRAAALIVVSRGGKEVYEKRGVPADKIFAAPNGVDLDDFSRVESREVSRERLGLSQDARIVLYAGRLDGWKGSAVLLDAAAYLPPGVLVVVVGGEERQVRELSEKYTRVRFLGYHPYRELPNNLAAADVLVLPNTDESEISKTFTSPLKLLAYMASGKPIVASDLPSIREIVDEHSAFLVRPDDARALAQGIVQVLNDAERARALGERAQELVRQHDWSTRAERIAEHLRDRIATL